MSEEQHGSEENGGIRINKFLASCGIDSRRVADRLIEEGRVEVNGKVMHILANRVSLSGELYRDNWIGKKATEAQGGYSG